jgi:hypothetical protein
MAQDTATASIDLFWSGVRLVATSVLVAAGIYYFANGLIPIWLDALGGRWAWMAAGAFASLIVLDELPDAARGFANAGLQLWATRRRAVGEQR